MPSEPLENLKFYLYRKDYKFITNYFTGDFRDELLPPDFLRADRIFTSTVENVIRDIVSNADITVFHTFSFKTTVDGEKIVHYCNYSLKVPEELNRLEIKTLLLDRVNKALKSRSSPYTVGTSPPHTYVFGGYKISSKKRKSPRKRRSSHRKKH